MHDILRESLKELHSTFDQNREWFVLGGLNWLAHSKGNARFQHGKYLTGFLCLYRCLFRVVLRSMHGVARQFWELVNKHMN
jgi:hypothetical protein